MVCVPRIIICLFAAAVGLAPPAVIPSRGQPRTAPSRIIPKRMPVASGPASYHTPGVRGGAPMLFTQSSRGHAEARVILGSTSSTHAALYSGSEVLRLSKVANDNPYVAALLVSLGVVALLAVFVAAAVGGRSRNIALQEASAMQMATLKHPRGEVNVVANRRPAIAVAAVASESVAEEEAQLEDDIEDSDEEGEEEVNDEEEEEDAKTTTKWMCIACNSQNFEQMQECEKCGAEKPTTQESKLFAAKAEAEAAVADQMDKLVRLQADLQNYRRETGESMSKATEQGKEDALRKLVPVIADIQTALVPPEGLSEREQALFGSYSLLFKKALDQFERIGIESQAVEVGSKFDPLLHRKVGEVVHENEVDPPGTIKEVSKMGFTLDGKVLIPSEVSIVAFPEDADADTAEADNEETSEENDVDGEENGEQTAQ